MLCPRDRRGGGGEGCMLGGGVSVEVTLSSQCIQVWTLFTLIYNIIINHRVILYIIMLFQCDDKFNERFSAFKYPWRHSGARRVSGWQPKGVDMPPSLTPFLKKGHLSTINHCNQETSYRFVWPPHASATFCVSCDGGCDIICLEKTLQVYLVIYFRSMIRRQEHTNWVMINCLI